jgi:hypothetical protein
MIARVTILAIAFAVGFTTSFAALSTAADATWMPFLALTRPVAG